jgi:hypothetical protein
MIADELEICRMAKNVIGEKRCNFGDAGNAYFFLPGHCISD